MFILFCLGFFFIIKYCLVYQQFASFYCKLIYCNKEPQSSFQNNLRMLFIWLSGRGREKQRDKERQAVRCEGAPIFQFTLEVCSGPGCAMQDPGVSKKIHSGTGGMKHYLRYHLYFARSALVRKWSQELEAGVANESPLFLCGAGYVNC